MTDCEVKTSRQQFQGRPARWLLTSACDGACQESGDRQGSQGSNGGIPGQPNRICTDTSSSPAMIVSQ